MWRALAITDRWVIGMRILRKADLWPRRPERHQSQDPTCRRHGGGRFVASWMGTQQPEHPASKVRSDHRHARSRRPHRRMLPLRRPGEVPNRDTISSCRGAAIGQRELRCAERKSGMRVRASTRGCLISVCCRATRRHDGLRARFSKRCCGRGSCRTALGRAPGHRRIGVATASGGTIRIWTRRPSTSRLS
jgi:hypothetical protein